MPYTFITMHLDLHPLGNLASPNQVTNELATYLLPQQLEADTSIRKPDLSK